MGKWPQNKHHSKPLFAKCALRYLINEGMQDEKFLSQDTERTLTTMFTGKK
jgi:hypothetical protein